jgi:zinc transport system substrate-binding protein
VTGLTQPGAEPHDLELTPRQVGLIGTADLVLYEKGLQPAVDEAVAQSGNSAALDITAAVPLQDLGTGEVDHTEDEADHNTLDPHVWLDPLQMVTIAEAVAANLRESDPDGADTYTANTKALTSELTDLDAAFRTGLATCARQTFVTSHAAFGYLARRYDLTQVPISGLSPDAEPSPGRIAEVQRLAKATGVTTIFSETLVSPALAEAIAGDLGLRTDVLDPVEGITDASRGRDYLAVMRTNLTALRAANGCR